MSETSTSLSAAASDRKARLAQLKSLKRKQAPTDETSAASQDVEDDAGEDAALTGTTTAFLSGRNYNPETRGPKLGFENAPTGGQETLEVRAKVLADTTKLQAEEDEKADKPLDLFKLQPKKPNWDLKRDLDKKLEVLNVRTDNAIARLVRDRIDREKKEAQTKGKDPAAETAGLDGNELVEAMHMRERENDEEQKRDDEEDESEED